MKKILIVGLGLIGGSLAMALRGFEDFEVVGAVRSQATYDKAEAMDIPLSVGNSSPFLTIPAFRNFRSTVLSIGIFSMSQSCATVA